MSDSAKGLQLNNAFKELYNLLLSVYDRIELQRRVNHGAFSRTGSGAFQLSGLL